jgi:uncharacterized cupredoxin-like copper-binding protein
MKRRIWAPAAAAVGALALLAAGCGGGGSDDPTKVAVQVTENGKGDYTVSVPNEIEGGAVELTLDNTKNQAPHAAQLIQLGEGHTYQEADAIINSQKPVPIPDWIHGYGGVGAVQPGQTGTATVKLDEGHYVVQDDAEGGPNSPYAEFDVKETNDADLPETDASVAAATTGQENPEYQWETSGLKAGPSEITFKSEGAEALHHIIAAPINGDATIEQVGQELDSNGPPRSIDIDNASQTEVLDGGKDQVLALNLKAGRYAFICFLPDRDEPDKPHYKTGLLKEVTIPSS